MAAITARERGSDVIAVSKGPIGGANCTLISHAGFRGTVKGFSEEDHFNITMQAGAGLNEPHLVRILAEDADKVLKLRRYGVPVQERSRGYFCHGQSGMEGAAIIKPLVRYAQEIGVKLISRTLMWELLVEDGVVVGAWGLDFGSGEYVHIAARAVVMAAGGAGAIYSRTDNPLRTTGDGYALAYRAGLKLADMEFVQFFPLGNANPAFANRRINAMTADVGKLLNKDGEDIVAKHGINVHPLAIQARDRLSRAICQEVAEGHGIDGAIALDLVNCGTEDWARGDQLFGEKSAESIREFLVKYFKIDEKPLLVLPTGHFFMGGIPIDGEGRTGISGLIAVGEVTAGVHGANRLGGNALTETVVFGERGGLEAARMAEARSSHKTALPERDMAEKIAQLPSVLTGEGEESEPLSTLRERLRQLMWEKVGVLRNEAGLRESLTEISYLSSNCRWDFDVNQPEQVIEAMELRNLMLVAEAVNRAALERRESRGSHYREDFPDVSDEWRLHLVVEHGNLGMNIGRSPIGSLFAGQEA